MGRKPVKDESVPLMRDEKASIDKGNRRLGSQFIEPSYIVISEA